MHLVVIALQLLVILSCGDIFFLCERSSEIKSDKREQVEAVTSSKNSAVLDTHMHSGGALAVLTFISLYLTHACSASTSRPPSLDTTLLSRLTRETEGLLYSDPTDPATCEIER